MMPRSSSNSKSSNTLTVEPRSNSKPKQIIKPPKAKSPQKFIDDGLTPSQKQRFESQIAQMKETISLKDALILKQTDIVDNLAKQMKMKDQAVTKLKAEAEDLKRQQAKLPE